MTTYTVKKNDSLWGIAKALLGDGSRYRELMKANNLKDTVIYPGMTLKVPSKTSGTNYEQIGRAFEKACDDVDKLTSVSKLFDLLGD